MIKQIKKMGIVIGTSMLVAGLCGCSQAETNSTAPTEPEVQTEEPSVIEEDPEEGKGDLIPEEEEITGYATLYLSEIDKLVSEGMADQFALVNIDGDDIPELVASDSAGSFDHDNAFIYTVSDEKAVLLAEAVTGVDGTALCFCEGKNLIRQSQGMAGATDVFSEIKDGKLEEVFKAEMIDTLETDADDETIYKYSVNGNDTDKAEYLDAFTKFIEPYDLLTSIDYDGLNKIKFVSDQDMAWFEKTEQGKYLTSEEITKQLESDG